jgi:hypothetical protein
MNFSEDQNNNVAWDNAKNRVSPLRASLCNEIFKVQVNQAKMMKENATKDDVLINVGYVVHGPLDVVNQKRVSYVKNITAVVVEVIKSGQSRCACATDVFYHPYAKHNFTPLQGTSNNQKLCGLKEVIFGVARNFHGRH